MDIFKLVGVLGLLAFVVSGCSASSGGGSSSGSSTGSGTSSGSGSSAALTTLTVGASAQTSSGVTSANYYQMSVTAGAAYTVTVNPSVGTASLYLCSSDPRTTCTVQDSSLTSGVNAISFVAPSGATEAYFMVTPGGTSPSTYSIDARSNALTVSNAYLGKTTITYANPEYLTMNLIGGQQYIMFIHNDTTSTSGTTNLYNSDPYNSTPTPQITKTTNANKVTSFTFTPSASGTYYVDTDIGDYHIYTEKYVEVAAPFTTDFSTTSDINNFVMNYDASWLPDLTTGNGDSYSLKSGMISDNEVSCATLYATGVTTSSYSFDVKTDADAGDGFYFYVDGAQVVNYTGTTPWTTYTGSTTAGAHEFDFCYLKDSSGSAGADAAWVDNISIN